MFKTFDVRIAIITGQNPAQPGIPMVAPAGATKDEIFLDTPKFFSRLSTFAGIDPTEDWVVKAIVCTEKFFLKNLKGFTLAKRLNSAPVVT